MRRDLAERDRVPAFRALASRLRQLRRVDMLTAKGLTLADRPLAAHDRLTGSTQLLYSTR